MGMNVEFINPFLSSITNVLATMATLDSSKGSLSIKQDELPQGDVTGVMSMNSPQSVGTFTVSFTKPVILHIAKNMLNEDFEEINETVQDLVGEITNMVSGGTKKLLGEKGYEFEMSFPTVVLGKDMPVSRQADGPIIIIPFTTEVGPFYVEVCFQDNPGK